MNEKVIIRADRAGVFYGELKENDRVNAVVVLNNARRLHYWDSVQGGTTGLACCKKINKNSQKFSDYVELIEIKNVLEINYCSDEAVKAIEEVPVWKI